MEAPRQVDHDKEVVTLDNATIEQCKAIIVACEARIEMVKRETSSQLRGNLRACAQAAGVPLRTFLQQLLAAEDGRRGMEPRRTRRPSGEVAQEREAQAKQCKYYDPVSKTGWNGMGRAPRAFVDPDTGLANRKFLEACRNPNYQSWSRADDAA